MIETEQQIKNLDMVYKSLGQKPEKVPCKGAAGIIAEFKSTTKDIKSPDRAVSLMLSVGLG